MTHETLRHFADTFGLLFLVLVFLVAIGMALRPGSRAAQHHARFIPLNDGE